MKNVNEIITNLVNYTNNEYMHIENFCKDIKDVYYKAIENEDYELVIEEFCNKYGYDCYEVYELIRKMI
jgi:hypothetical protein